MGATVEYNATMVERVDISEVLAIFRVKPDTPLPESARPFVPGQYMTLGLNNEAEPDKGGVRRPMSIASHPQSPDLVEFYVRYVNTPESDNPLTHLLWKLQNGDRMFLRPQPLGKFTIEDTIGADDGRLRVLVAAGTGLAPFTAMAFEQAALDPKADLSKWVVMHAASYDHELGYRDQLEKLASEQGLRYLPTVSRCHKCPDWKGDCGRVEDYFLPERLEDTEKKLGLEPGGLTPDNAAILICGLTGTIAQTIERLLPRGFVPDNRRIRKAIGWDPEIPATIFWEAYDTEPVLKIKDPDEVERLRALLP